MKMDCSWSREPSDWNSPLAHGDPENCCGVCLPNLSIVRHFMESLCRALNTDAGETETKGRGGFSLRWHCGEASFAILG